MTWSRFQLWRLKSLLIRSSGHWRFFAFILENLQKDLTFIILLKTKKKESAALSDCTPINAKKWTRFPPEIFARRLDLNTQPQAIRFATRIIRLFCKKLNFRSRSFRCVLNRKPKPTRRKWACLCRDWRKKIPLFALKLIRKLARLLSLAWENCILRFLLIECSANSKSPPMWELPI